MVKDGRKIVGVSLSPEAYAKLRLLGDQLGLKDAAAAKHLIMMSLQSLMGQLNQLQQGNILEKMAEMMKDELGQLEDIQAEVIRSVQDRDSSGGASNTATKGKKLPLSVTKKGAKRA